MLRGSTERATNSVSPPCLTSHTALCYGGLMIPSSDEKTEASGEEGCACGRAKSPDAGAQACPVPGTQETGGFPEGSHTIRQSEHCTQRENEAQKGLAIPVTVQAAAVPGQNPRQLCLQSPRPTCTQDPKPQPSGAGPPSPPPRTIQPPSRQAKHGSLHLPLAPNSVKGL